MRWLVCALDCDSLGESMLMPLSSGLLSGDKLLEADLTVNHSNHDEAEIDLEEIGFEETQPTTNSEK